MLVEKIINKRLSKRLVAQSSKEMNDNCSVYPTVVGLFLEIYLHYHTFTYFLFPKLLPISSLNDIKIFQAKDLISLIEIAAKEENVQVLKAAYIRMQVVY